MTNEDKILDNPISENQSPQPNFLDKTVVNDLPENRYPDAIFHLEADKIKPNPYQPRKNFDEELLKELAASIREFGIIQPLVVSKIEKETETGTQVEYQLIAGERRLMAAKILGLERVPAIVRRISSGAEQMELAIVENLQRANLNPIETARAYAKLQEEFRLTQREIAVQLSKSRETIANTLRLLNLPNEIQEAVGKGQINESQARLLLAIEEPAQQIAIFKELLTNNLSVRELKNRIRKTLAPEPVKTEMLPENAAGDSEIIHLQEQLIEILGAPVKIEKTTGAEKAGKIVITFYSPEEIRGIIDKLTSNP
ncbi:MAG: ParB-like protein partition protein [Candidatus Wolfebacteria bacterium GW2011_GWA1_44_24]|uniref:ParB-like protein partition protein n=2 Tax=Candidatus Wolfeibacteriota TaxID=1752735 RepID=A0A0G0UJK6_9BACT|nr:MAG: ParB-like protein partition protein [Candidatus Wolfebacteria bacterium GW2011_GWB1_41_12]KKT56347.1 MAG: ParB-like protein partition protein [Candidatus Wolfebacteria bacterium GW2011_GWA1_44_24]